MELSKYNKLSKEIIDDETLRMCEIYKITCLTSGKCYVGQAVSHILNHRRYRPYGRNGRFKCHISEAYSRKKCQSKYLNNAIKKYGVNDFTLTLLEVCECSNSNEREIFHIKNENSLFPNGYNLNEGGQQHKHCDESKKRVSVGLSKYYAEKKFLKYKNIKYDDIDVLNIEKYIKPLKRNGVLFGYYIYINKIKTDFGGVHINPEDSYNKAIEFIKELKLRLAKHLDAGNSLESQTTTPTLETELEELG
jgi:group I intron endonuclease